MKARIEMLMMDLNKQRQTQQKVIIPNEDKGRDCCYYERGSVLESGGEKKF